jgi:HK97 family phage major capsid protein
MGFVADWIGRGMAKTHNDLLVNEIQTNGSSLELMGTTAAALGDLENAAFGSSVAYYTDEVGSVGWVMQPPTYAALLALGGTSNRYYSVETGLGHVGGRPNLLGYPVHFSNKVDAYANGQPILFGNWNYVGLYESPTLQMLRDPYTRSDYGQTGYNFYFRADYGVLQSGAIGYLRHINT